jgi:tripartite-type tricarboxylate transporter receptor subunit TctC
VTDGVFIVRPEVGIDSIDDARRKQISIGIPGAGSATATDVTVLNRLLGTKFKLVSGYNSGTEVKLALERGEVEGVGSTSWRIDRAWIQRNKFKVLYSKSPEVDPSLPNVPSLTDLARNDDEREILRFFHSQVDIARSFLAPPGVPADRVKLLRAAFLEMTKDKQLQAEAKNLNLNLDVLSGEELQKTVVQASNIPERLRQKAIEVSRPEAD